MMRAKRRIYVEKEKRLSTSYLRLLIILDFGYFSEWSLCPGGRYALGHMVDGEYLDLLGDLNITGKFGVSWSNFNISDSREKDLTKFASKRTKPFSLIAEGT